MERPRLDGPAPLFLPGAVNGLFAVPAPAATYIWAAEGGYRTLVEHICPAARG